MIAINVVRMIVWLVMFLAVAVVAMIAIKAKPDTVFQQCAIASQAAASFIAIYVVARAADKIIDSVGQLFTSR